MPITACPSLRFRYTRKEGRPPANRSRPQKVPRLELKKKPRQSASEMELKGGLGGQQKLFVVAGSVAAKHLFNLAPHRFDGIEVRRVGRQTEKPRTPRLDRFAYAADFVSREIIQDHHATGEPGPPRPKPKTSLRSWAPQTAKERTDPADGCRRSACWSDSFPHGMRPTSLRPPTARPHKRVIFVLAPLSSTNTKQGSSSAANCSCQCALFSATSGRSCSAAARVFFTSSPDDAATGLPWKARSAGPSERLTRPASHRAARPVVPQAVASAPR
jgi:hypothetical protein